VPVGIPLIRRSGPCRSAGRPPTRTTARPARRSSAGHSPARPTGVQGRRDESGTLVDRTDVGGSDARDPEVGLGVTAVVRAGLPSGGGPFEHAAATKKPARLRLGDRRTTPAGRRGRTALGDRGEGDSSGRRDADSTGRAAAGSDSRIVRNLRVFPAFREPGTSLRSRSSVAASVRPADAPSAIPTLPTAARTVVAFSFPPGTTPMRSCQIPSDRGKPASSASTGRRCSGTAQSCTAPSAAT
jgi:hypothetical protein